MSIVLRYSCPQCGQPADLNFGLTCQYVHKKTNQVCGYAIPRHLTDFNSGLLGKVEKHTQEPAGVFAGKISYNPDDVPTLIEPLGVLVFRWWRMFGRVEPQKKGWPPGILAGVHTKCIEFIKHWLGPNGPQGITVDRTRWEPLLHLLQSGREVITKAFVLESGGAKTCYFLAGNCRMAQAN